ncbi:MAG TPA: DoxX family protein [Terriglobales bacterium]|nr:DoxX family protein [Terriglobales bacterium]
MNFDARLNSAWWVLRLGFGLVPIAAGMDKFFNLLADWPAYLSPLVPRVLHLQPATFMHLVGVIEIAAGVVVLSRFTRFGAYLVMFWLLGIAANLVSQGAYLDIAVRDISMSLGAFALARLTEVRESVFSAHETSRVADRSRVAA